MLWVSNAQTYAFENITYFHFYDKIVFFKFIGWRLLAFFQSYKANNE